MKKILLAIIIITLLSSCGWDSDDVLKAKQNLGIIERDIEEEPEISGNKWEDIDEWENESSSQKRIDIVQLSWEKLLELDELNYSDFKAGYAKITGKTLWSVDSIKVDFSNADSDAPNDWFTLKKFKSGDSTFEYNANSKFKVLDFWTNVYTFTALSSWEKSVLQLRVIVSEDDDQYLDELNNWEKVIEDKDDEINKEEDKKEEEEEDTTVHTEFDASKLPSWWDYGTVQKLWGTSFTYSDLKWLEIQEATLWTVSCGKNSAGEYYITNFLWKRQKSWYYWNTCRPIENGKWISFFVTRLQWDKYIYEKHYLDTNHGLYGTYELDSWTWATSSNLNSFNKTLKAKNAQFESVGVVDSLFQKIVK